MIDGLHRVRVAQLNGQEVVDVAFVDGTEEEAFALSALLNVCQGLPLPLDDRKAAAARILLGNPDWSDRFVASLVGLSHKTVANIRRCSTGGNRRSNGRVGRDGRSRPTDPAGGRLRAAALLAQHPHLSLRQLARAAEISVSTARDVRLRLDNGKDPVPDRLRADMSSAPMVATANSESARVPAVPTDEHCTTAPDDALAVLGGPGGRNAAPPSGRPGAPFDLVLERLKKDPAVRFNDAGRSLVRQLIAGRIAVTSCQRMLSFAPAHCLATVAELAHSHADAWQQLAALADAKAEMQHAL